jgi:hypothetical protein
MQADDRAGGKVRDGVAVDVRSRILLGKSRHLRSASYSRNARRVAFLGCRFGVLSSAPFPFWCSTENETHGDSGRRLLCHWPRGNRFECAFGKLA